MRSISLLLGLTLLLPGAAEAQQANRIEPVDGLRNNTTTLHALTGARVVVAPGQVLNNATIVVRDGYIEAVGTNVQAPAGARIWDLSGHSVYPGFVDAHANLGMDGVPENGDIGPTHWNPQVRAWFSTTTALQDDEDRRSAIRSQGFGAALAIPQLGIFRGQAGVIDLGDGNVRQRVLRPNLVQSVSFSRSFQLGGAYPNSPMGVIALMKQTLLDADWYIRAWDAYEAGGRSFLPPETSDALASLETVVQGSQPVMFQVGSEEEYLRAQKIVEEFGIEAWFRGSGLEYRIIDVIEGYSDPLVIPLDFPDAPNVSDPQEALDVGLAELRHWYTAPENPGRLAAAGIEFAITTDGLPSIGDFLPNLRAAVARGLSPDDALAALTTTPAGYLGIDGTHGTIAAGKVANLVVSAGDLFTEEAPVRDVWVEGERYGVSQAPRVDPRGTWRIASDDEWGFDADIRLDGTLGRLTGAILIDGNETRLSNITASTEAGSFQFRFDGEALDFEQGTVLLEGSIDGDDLFVNGTIPNGATPQFRGTRIEAFEGDPGPRIVASNVPELNLADIRPAMEYGRASLPDQPAVLVVRNATVWTQGPQGKLENADLLVEAGKVVQVGQNLNAPSGAVEIDATGKHVTPGLIDPHIHSGTSGTNESGFAIVPEVRMEEVVTHNNANMYRQLAGGLTTAHIKHGSANPIGGQNVFVKMRWGMLPEDLKIADPPRTVKFALGENPKRRQGRYPDTRMGTQEIIRDHFQAARDYEAAWDRWEATGQGLPPRRDLRMEALVDILNQELLISSHGYRQDEFLALIRLAEEFDFRVQTLQHGVEAYKIAPELAASGVAAVVWSDWSAFKLEAYDATIYNAKILLEAGVVTALHSDDSQIAARMNWEAGKLLRTGVEEIDALSTVTNRAAQALAIDDRIGSLEPGKDADFVIWSGYPLSQFTRAEQTWVDGMRFFSLEEDAQLRQQIERERSMLIQAILQEN